MKDDLKYRSGMSMLPNYRTSIEHDYLILHGVLVCMHVCTCVYIHTIESI